MSMIDSIDGLFHDGDPVTGEKGTKVSAEFLNALLGLITGRGGGVRNVIASGAVSNLDSVLLVDASAGPVVLTLLSAGSISARLLTVIKTDDTENPVTLQAQPGQTLPTSQGRLQALDLTIQDEFIRVLPNGAAHWHRVG